MFGALGLAKQCLSAPEQELYQAHFCGLCHTMAGFGGRVSSLLTNYDLTFWLIVLGALEPAAPVERRACTALPWRKVPVLAMSPRAQKAAAALNLALVAAKVEDDRTDGDGWWRRLAFRAFAGPASRATPVLRELGFPLEVLATLGARQSAVEARFGATLEELAEPSAALLSEAFAWQSRLAERPDLAPALRRAGHALGRYLYWWDAFQDREQDRRAGRFNALEACPEPIHPRLVAELGKLEEALGELPLGERAGLAEGLLGTLQVRLGQAFQRKLKLSRPMRRRLARAGMVTTDCDGCDCGGADCSGCDCSGCDCGHCHGCDCHGCDGICNAECCEACSDGGDCCDGCSNCNLRSCNDPTRRDWCPICCCYTASTPRVDQPPRPKKRRKRKGQEEQPPVEEAPAELEQTDAEKQ